MKEAEIIQDAYAANLKDSYASFSVAYRTANGNPDLQNEAETNFRQDMQHAKKVKERALAVLLGL